MALLPLVDLVSGSRPRLDPTKKAPAQGARGGWHQDVDLTTSPSARVTCAGRPLRGTFGRRPGRLLGTARPAVFGYGARVYGRRARASKSTGGATPGSAIPPLAGVRRRVRGPIGAWIS